MPFKNIFNLWVVSLIYAGIPLPSYAAGTDAYSIAAVVQTPSFADQSMLFQAIDTGDLARIKAHINFVHSFTGINSAGQGRINLEFADQGGNTPLIRAAMQNKSDIVHYLLSNGVNINAVNLKNETALIVAYNAGYFDLAKYLIARGAQDPYHAAQLMQQYEAQVQYQAQLEEAVAPDNRAVDGILWTAGGVVAAAGAVYAAGRTDSDGPDERSSSSSSPALPLECGASSGIHPEACDHTDFQTTEAAAQEGVLAMKTDYALSHGYDGRIFNRDSGGNLVDDVSDGHVLVAVIDTGVDLDHPDLDANLRTDLAVTCTTASGCVSGGGDSHGHGTNVAGIIAAERNGVDSDGFGMHGIAPEAHIIPIAALVNAGSTTAALKYANNNGAQAINNSWGYVYDVDLDTRSIPIVDATGAVVPIYHPTGDYDALTPAQLRSLLTTTEDSTTDLAQFEAAVSAHRLIVFSAGNSGLTEPGVMAGLPLYFRGATAPGILSQVNYDIVNPEHYDWSNNWVASISLDDNGAISSFSHQCGVAKDWCLAAPGEVASTTANGGGYEANDGTSFAAPNVTGAIAVMLGAFPQLDPEEVLQILFDTATDLGAAGVDSVYGHGLVNLQKATDPTTGGWTLTSLGSSFSLSRSGVGLSAPFGGGGTNPNARLIFLDSYGKDYTIPLSVLYSRLEKRESSYDRYAAFGSDDFDSKVQLGGKTRLGFSAVPNASSDPTRDIQDTGKFAVETQVSLGESSVIAGVGYHADLAALAADNMPRQYVASGAYENPYLQLVDHSMSSTVGYASGDVSTRVMAYAGDVGYQYDYHLGTTKNINGVYAETRYEPQKGKMLTISNGVLVEQNSMLGSETGGAFAIDKSVTYHTGFAGRYALGDSFSLLAQYHMGMTQVTAADNSLFTDFASVFTNAFALGAEARGIAHDADALGIVFSQPLRVSSGSTQLALPVDVGAGKQVFYSAARMGLAPTDSELNIESYYHYKLDKKSELGFNGIFRIAPENNGANDNDATFLAKYKYQIGL